MAARQIIASERLPEKGIIIGNDMRRILEKDGVFPRRVPITNRTHGYVEDEIDAYLEARIAARDASKSEVVPGRAIPKRKRTAT